MAFTVKAVDILEAAESVEVAGEWHLKQVGIFSETDMVDFSF